MVFDENWSKIYGSKYSFNPPRTVQGATLGHNDLKALDQSAKPNISKSKYTRHSKIKTGLLIQLDLLNSNLVSKFNYLNWLPWKQVNNRYIFVYAKLFHILSNASL